MQPEQLMALRRADMKTALVLMIISTLVIIESLSFPLTGSYAGVQVFHSYVVFHYLLKALFLLKIRLR